MKILLIKTSSYGDIVQTFPVVSYLRKKFPSAQIDWVVERRCQDLLVFHPDINNVLVIDSRRWASHPFKELGKFRSQLGQYDVVFDLQGNIKSAALISQVRSKNKVGFEWKNVAEWPNLLFTNCKINPPEGENIREDYLYVVKKFFNDNGPFSMPAISLKLSSEDRVKVDKVASNMVLVCLGASWPNKRLSVGHAILFLNCLNKGPYLFCWGNEGERVESALVAASFPGSFVLDKLSLAALQHVIKKSSLLVAMDSLVLHLCGTTETPSISFFGPSSGKKYAPQGEGHKFIQGKCPYGNLFDKRCPKLRSCRGGECLKALDVVKCLSDG